MSTILLERIQKVYPDYLDQFDFIAGTSNGSMIAMGFVVLPFSTAKTE
jgi:patatin-like phospholipase/acyl hydrolase